MTGVFVCQNDIFCASMRYHLDKYSMFFVRHTELFLYYCPLGEFFSALMNNSQPFSSVLYMAPVTSAIVCDLRPALGMDSHLGLQD